MSLVVAALFAGVMGCASSSSGTSGTGTPQAPMLMEVIPMASALHLTWMNNQADCDTVEAERKMGSDAFATAFSVPGTVDNKMDTAATDDMMYTYRLRCKKGGAYSGYSTEMGANPHLTDAGTDH